MKIFDAYTEWDYGRDAYLTIGQFENFNVFDIEFHTTDYWSWEPNIRLTLSIFDGKVFSFNLQMWSVSFDLDFISYRAPFNLSHTRE